MVATSSRVRIPPSPPHSVSDILTGMNSTLYILGLGSQRVDRMQKAWVAGINLFRSSNNKIHVFESRWETDEPYDDKFERLREFHEQIGRPSRVWAVSAGATLAVRLCVEVDDDVDLHIVCGKIYGPEKIGQDYINRAPAFLESAQISDELARRVNPEFVTCYVPKNDADGVIESIDMQIPDAQSIELPALKHAKAITYALVRYLPAL
jgi:hypothetical protein